MGRRCVERGALKALGLSMHECSERQYPGHLLQIITASAASRRRAQNLRANVPA